MIQQLGIVSKHHNMAQITDESYLYNGVCSHGHGMTSSWLLSNHLIQSIYIHIDLLL